MKHQHNHHVYTYIQVLGFIYLIWSYHFSWGIPHKFPQQEVSHTCNSVIFWKTKQINGECVHVTQMMPLLAHHIKLWLAEGRLGVWEFFAAVKTYLWPSSVVCSMVELLSLWHIPHFHSQFYYQYEGTSIKKGKS